MPADRLYYTDSHLLQFTARVSDVREYARLDGKQVWQIALDRTAFYPTSGGQPHDTGTLTARARSGAALTLPVEDVMTEEDGEIWHTTAKPLLAGTAVEASVDAARRLDHTQQHSGQHLLSAVLADAFGAATVSFHLGTEDTTIDLAVEAAEAQATLLTRLPAVEQQVNAAIAANLPVTVHTVLAPEAQAMLADGRLRKLPELTGDVRVIEIAGLDRNACGGTHVRALGEIGCMLLRETERMKRGLRLHFVCGGRAVSAARRDWEQLGAAAAHLSTGREHVAAAVERRDTELRAATKERGRLLERLAALHAAQLLQTPTDAAGVLRIDALLTGEDAAYARLLAQALLRCNLRFTALLTTRDGDQDSVLLAAGVPLPQGCGQLLRETLAHHGLRGGGSAELAQASVPSTLLDTICAQLRAALQSAGRN